MTRRKMAMAVVTCPDETPPGTSYTPPFARIFGCCLAVILLVCGIATAYEVPSYAELTKNREALVEWQATNQSGVEFFIRSESNHGVAETDIALFFDSIDLDEGTAILSGPDAWCEVLFLHMNVKTCTYGKNEDDQWLKMYMGRKFYQKPKKDKAIELQFNSGLTDDGVNWVAMTADEGPFNTSDYYLGLFAIQAENGIYVQLRSSQKTGRAASSAMNLYYKTLARDKIGFSVVGTDKKGNPEYSKGTQAMLERNVVRYLLAMRVFTQTHTISGLKGLQTRAKLWYDATERYAEQLHEVERDDFLHHKEKEYQNMVEMQAAQ